MKLLKWLVSWLSVFEYGYITSSHGETRRVVLGKIRGTEYDRKQLEIERANRVSSIIDPTDNTQWFIEQA